MGLQTKLDSLVRLDYSPPAAGSRHFPKEPFHVFDPEHPIPLAADRHWHDGLDESSCCSPQPSEPTKQRRTAFLYREQTVGTEQASKGKTNTDNFDTALKLLYGRFVVKFKAVIYNRFGWCSADF